MDLSILDKIPSYLWAIILTLVIMSWMMRFSKRPIKPLSDGSIRLKLNLGMYFLGLCALLIALLGIGLLVTITFEPSWGAAPAISLAISALLLLLGVYGFYCVFLIRAQFDDDGILYQSPRLRRFFAWDEMHKIVDSTLLGTYVQTDSGKLIIMKYRSGFPQFLELARKNDVLGADNPWLSKP